MRKFKGIRNYLFNNIEVLMVVMDVLAAILGVVVAAAAVFGFAKLFGIL